MSRELMLKELRIFFVQLEHFPVTRPAETRVKRLHKKM